MAITRNLGDHMPEFRNSGDTIAIDNVIALGADPTLGAGAVGTTEIADEAVTVGKMADLTRGSMISGQTASNRPAALVAKSSGYVLVGDGTDVNSVAISGDIGLTNTGLTSISTGVIVNTDVNASAAIAFSKLATLTSGNVLVGSAGGVATSVAISGDATLAATGALTVGNNGQYVEVALTKANILAMNGAPVEVIAAQAGKAIEVISAVLIYDYATAAYGAGGDVSLIYAGAVVLTGVVSAANSLGAAADKIAYVQPAVPTNNQLLSNTAVQITNATGAFTDPGTAAGVARLQISYRTHTTGL